MPIIEATPGHASANSYLTLAEANLYFASRAPMAGWENADDPSALLIMATRTLDMMLSPSRQFVPASGSQEAYFRIRPTWTGAPASTTQALAWPRIGMFNRNGVAILSTVVPGDLKNAVAELAGALGTKDTLVDNDNAVQGITSVKAGSVGISFAQGVMTSKVLPDSVLFMLVPSWLTQEYIEGAQRAQFDVLV